MVEKVKGLGFVDREHCDFSCSEKICLMLDAMGVPPESKWRTLVFYMRGLEDHEYLTDQQKKQTQSLLLKLLREKRFTDETFNEVVEENKKVFNAPYIKKLEEAADESEKLLLEFQDLLKKRRGDIQKLGTTTIGAIEKGKDPKELIQELRSAFHDLIAVLDQDAANLEYLSKTDGLTGLQNRRVFDEFLQKYTEQATKESLPFSLILLDIDHFKKFNDTYGHRIGDQALATVAKIIKQNIQEGSRPKGVDYCGARYGGEEFAVVMPHASLNEAVKKAKTIREQIESYSFVVRNSQGNILHKNIRITASLGVAELKPDWRGKIVETLIDAADQALYSAKSRGRNRVCIQG